MAATACPRPSGATRPRRIPSRSTTPVSARTRGGRDRHSGSLCELWRRRHHFPPPAMTVSTVAALTHGAPTRRKENSPLRMVKRSLLFEILFIFRCFGSANDTAERLNGSKLVSSSWRGTVWCSNRAIADPARIPSTASRMAHKLGCVCVRVRACA